MADSAHEWSQSESEVVVRVPIDASASKASLKIKIEASQFSVSVAGKPVFFKELASKVVVDDSYWSLEGTGADRVVVVTLGKKKNTQWRTLTKEEEEVLPQTDVLDANFDVLNLEHDDDDPERVEEQEENERKLEARYKKLCAEKGLEDENTLQTFFALFDNCIQLYRLNKLSDYLEEIVPVCRKRTDKYKLKAIQALAFVRWKQSKFREALPLFHEMEEILGKGAALCENIAHTYNSLGDYDRAEDYFRQALKFIEQEHGSNQGNRGGVLLGLGLVRDRLGKHREALPVCTKAYEFYKDRANGAPASLQAKAGISCAKLHAKLGDLRKSESYIREAVQMYEITCGETSPLTASAYHELGKCLWAQRRRADAQKALKRAYEIESMKDAWDLVTLLEIHNLLMDTHLKETEHIERSKFEDYFTIVEYITNRVKKELPQDGNAAVYYKAAAELKAWGGKYSEAQQLFEVALPLFRSERTTDCTELIQACNDMLAFCERNLEGKQNSPMDFEVPAKHAAPEADGDDGGIHTDGVVIEELGTDYLGEDDPMVGIQPGPRELKCRGTVASDYASIMLLSVECETEPLFQEEGAFKRHLGAGGAGHCWVAEKDGDLVGFALCSTDGVFLHLLQLVVVDDDGDNIRHELVERCASDSQITGLRALRVAAAVGGGNCAFFDARGWAVCQKVFEKSWGDGARAAPKQTAPAQAAAAAAPTGGGAPKPPQKPGGAKAAAAAAAPAPSAASSASTKLRRDKEDTDTYYGAWDQMNVDKVIVEEDGGDSSIVPNTVPEKEDFGEANSRLDVATRIQRYSWDQSDKFVSLYIPYDGVGTIAPENVDCVFRPRGVLLTINSGGQKYWYKVPNLCQEIDLTASKRNIKADQVVIKLKKLKTGSEWSDLTDEKDRYKSKREYRIQHGDLKDASTEQLLADMYQNANDDERAGLRDAMRVNREKRAEEAARAHG